MRDGFVVPLSFRTNCKAEARISSGVAGGSKLARVLMFRHIDGSRCRHAEYAAESETARLLDRATTERRDRRTARLPNGATARWRKGASRHLLDVSRFCDWRAVFRQRRFGNSVPFNVARPSAEGA